MENKAFDNIEKLWQPNEDSGKGAKEFRKRIENKYHVKINDYWDLHKWSIENIPEFWAEVWNLAGLIHSKPYDKVIDTTIKMEDSPEWFTGARLNFAENLLKIRDDHTALIVAGEDRETEFVTYAQVYEEACLYGAALRKIGFQKNDVAACYMSNRKEAILAMLGVASIGGIWTGTLPLFGSKAVLNRFLNIQPKIMFTLDRFICNGEEEDMLSKVYEIVKELPTLEKVVIVPSKASSKLKDISHIKNSCFLEEFLESVYLEDGSVPPLEFEQLPLNHPLFISFTSGTTGPPKALVHGPGMLLSLTRDNLIHQDFSRDQVFLFISPVGWSTWNMSVVLLSYGATLILFEGSPYFLTPTYLWDMVDEFKLTHLLLTTNILDGLEKTGYVPTSEHHLTSLKVIINGASVVKPQNYDFVYNKIKKDVLFSSMYGSTEFMGTCMINDLTLPIYKGEISAPSLGCDLRCIDDSGKEVMGEVGELALASPLPSLPLGMWGDVDNSRFKEAYFSKYSGKFTIGDLVLFNPITRGILIYGRSDETLIPGGCRFGSLEIYNIVDAFPEVKESLCVSQYSKDLRERVVLFLKMKKGHDFTKDLVQRIRETIAKELTARHVPEIILQTSEIPYNFTGKKMEIVVKKVINNLPYNDEAVKNPECLENFKNLPELQSY